MMILKSADVIPDGFFSVEHRRGNRNYAAHGHDFFEIEYILGGRGSYLIDGIPYPVEADTVFLMTPARIHELHWESAEYYNISFNAERCPIDPPAFLLGEDCPPLIRLSREDSAFFASLLGELVLTKAQNREYAFLLLNCLLQKLSLSVPDVPKVSRERAINRAMIFLLQSFRSPLTLGDMAAHAGLTPSYFSTLFAQRMGMSFKEYLDKLRFSEAAKLLSFTDLTVAQICDQSGFSDYANFQRRFRKRFGQSPLEYRRTVKERKGKTEEINAADFSALHGFSIEI